MDTDWLDTDEGRAWLESDQGVAWVNSGEGIAWSRTAAGERWHDKLAQQGWDAMFAGRMPVPPDWAMSPNSAPRIGDRVRLTDNLETPDGTLFSDGELTIVTTLHLAPNGSVRAQLRTPDGRVLHTMNAAIFRAAEL